MAVELNERRKQIKRLQDNLSSIRKIAGWSAEVFGEKLGVTKQTISNLENQKTPMHGSRQYPTRTKSSSNKCMTVVE